MFLFVVIAIWVKGVVIDNPYFDKEYFEIDEIENFEDDVTIWVK